MLSSFQFLTSKRPHFLPSSSMIWYSLFSLPHPSGSTGSFSHLLLICVLNYHFSREAFPDHSIWSSNSLGSSLQFLLLFISSWPICLSAYCVPSTVTPFPSPLGTSHYLAELCVYFWTVWLPWNITGVPCYLYNKSRLAFNFPDPFSQSTKSHWAIFTCQPLCKVSELQKRKRHGPCL